MFYNKDPLTGQKTEGKKGYFISGQLGSVIVSPEKWK